MRGGAAHITLAPRLRAIFAEVNEEGEAAIDLARSPVPEFQDWRWVNYWYPIRKVVHFQRRVYARALRELAPALRALSSEHREARGARRGG